MIKHKTYLEYLRDKEKKRLAPHAGSVDEANHKKTVVTICLGSDYARMSRLTHPLMRRYAKKIGADFIVIDKARIKTTELEFEKFQLYGLLKKYDRILCLDSDILVRPDCPDLFKFVAPAKLGAFVEDSYGAMKAMYRGKSIRRIQKTLGNIGWKYGYFNGGVLVLSKIHRPMFNPEWLYPRPYEDLRAQTLLNYIPRKLGLPIQDIGIRFNRMDFRKVEDRLKSYIIHYAGAGFTGRFGNFEEKIDRIKKDLVILTSKNRLGRFAS